jgi:DNA ligase-4
MSPDIPMQDADALHEEDIMYSNMEESPEELAEKYPNRPHNHSKSLPFHSLHLDLFNPLLENRKAPGSTGPARAPRKGKGAMTKTEIRSSIIRSYVARWRNDVGNDIYPAFRLILPDQDRERAMYGLKEKLIANLLVRVMGIHKTSPDAIKLLDWKVPGQKYSASAGDFGARCFEVLSKRPMRTKVGDMTIAEVNAKLDQLSLLSKQEDQQPIFDYFYRHMNPEEMSWLIRIILRQMRLGATEKTMFHEWHPDAVSLFNVSSSLRRVCWELSDPSIRLPNEQSQITLMSCFQPQLAGFQLSKLDQILGKMRPLEDDNEFWIEEKLDGERMQMHMIEDLSIPGGFRFSFWSRKAKDYTYLYGSGYEDLDSSLTKYLKDAFNDNVRNIILDGEMISWDTETDVMIPFGHLKTAALDEKKNPYTNTRRPLFRIFDCLYLNDKPLTPYTLRDRRKALIASINPIERRFEVHNYAVGTTVEDIEEKLRKVIAESSEGLVIKSPRSSYRVNDRNDDWIKVKPEYMDEYGEDLDCVIIAGYYGSGHRGGKLSSFLCGIRPESPHRQPNDDPQLFWSFFKVGGGFSASDYQDIYTKTAGKWKAWDPKKPPSRYIELGGGERQYERPDEWIMPEDSVVVSVKAASTHITKQFRTGYTLRFPRFSKIRDDRSWENSLTTVGFQMLKTRVEKEHEEKVKSFQVNIDRKTRRQGAVKKKKTIQLADATGTVPNPYGAPSMKVFEGLVFFVTSGSTSPETKSKGDIEAMIKVNGGQIVQTHTGKEKLIVIGEKKNLKTGAIQKTDKFNIIKPSWIFDAIRQSQVDVGKQSFLLPLEPRLVLLLVA